MLLLIPLSDDRVYGYASATGRDEVGDDPGWLSRTFERYPERVRQAVSSALREPAELHHSPVHEVRLSAWHRGAVVLIGDAAHSLAPVWRRAPRWPSRTHSYSRSCSPPGTTGQASDASSRNAAVPVSSTCNG